VALVPQRGSDIGHPSRVDRFLEFLRTGAIDGLAVGARPDDVRRKLGPPDDVSSIEPPIWRYEHTEIVFRDGCVVMITVSANADAQAVTNMLDDAGVTYEPHTALAYDEQIAYVVGGSRVTLTLDATLGVARGFAH
jgi:threonine synthase